MAPAHSIASKIQARFIAPVLSAVADLPEEKVKAEESPSAAFIKGILGDPDLEVGKRTYSIEADCKAVLHFALKGDTTFFREHFTSLLGEGWSCGADKASVILPPNLQGHAFEPMISKLKAELEGAVRAFHAQWVAAWQSLHSVAQDAYWSRVHVQRAMEALKIPKEPRGSDVSEQVGDPPPNTPGNTTAALDA